MLEGIFKPVGAEISRAQQLLKTYHYREAIKAFKSLLVKSLTVEQKEEIYTGLRQAYLDSANQANAQGRTHDEEIYLQDYIDLIPSGTDHHTHILRRLAHVRQQNYLLYNPQTKHAVRTENPRRVDNLVFQGGGIKGLAYMGAYQTLPDYININQVERIGGTSAGAITAVCIAAGYTEKEYAQIVNALDFRNLMDGQHRDKVLGLSKKPSKESYGAFKSVGESTQKSQMGSTVASLLSELGEDHLGLFPGDFFRDYLEKCLQRKTGIPHLTFRELHELKEENPDLFKDLYVVGVNINTGKAEVFSFETTPDAIISDAVRISMSIPVLFEPHQVYIKNEDGMRVLDPTRSEHFYVDGGILDNYPLWLFDYQRYLNDKVTIDAIIENPYTLGFRLVTEEQQTAYEMNQLLTQPLPTKILPYVSKIFNIILHKESSDHIKRQECDRTIYVDYLGINTIDFDLNEEQKTHLIESGCKAVNHYYQIRKPLPDSQHFWKALEDGDITTIKQFATQGDLLNQPNTQGTYPLDIALAKYPNSPWFILKLLRYGAHRCDNITHTQIKEMLQNASTLGTANPQKLHKLQSIWDNQYQPLNQASLPNNEISITLNSKM